MINWPAIIKLSDDVELIYVRDQAEWDNDADLHRFDYGESDFLFDSSARLFSLCRREGDLVIPEPRENSISLAEILGLIKAHAAQKGSCCVAKIHAPSIAEAFKIAASLDAT